MYEATHLKSTATVFVGNNRDTGKAFRRHVLSPAAHWTLSVRLRSFDLRHRRRPRSTVVACPRDPILRLWLCYCWFGLLSAFFHPRDSSIVSLHFLLPSLLSHCFSLLSPHLLSSQRLSSPMGHHSLNHRFLVRRPRRLSDHRLSCRGCRATSLPVQSPKHVGGPKRRRCL